MDLLGNLNRLKEFSFNTMLEARPDVTAGGGGPQHGKPGDYGMMGRARNMPVTPRMAGGNVMSALIGHAAPMITQAAKPYMDSAMGALAGQIKGLNSNVAGNY
jgi:hypothetical protein